MAAQNRRTSTIFGPRKPRAKTAGGEVLGTGEGIGWGLLLRVMGGEKQHYMSKNHNSKKQVSNFSLSLELGRLTSSLEIEVFKNSGL